MAEKILRTEYSEEMQRSYMNYSMSVITARAIGLRLSVRNER